ncbi:MAG: enoyl-CoA hydratase-related protein, partial [Chloroflexota bacterium]
MEFDNILFGRAGSVAAITLDHPPANTLSVAMLKELDVALDKIEKDQAVRAVL